MFFHYRIFYSSLSSSRQKKSLHLRRVKYDSESINTRWKTCPLTSNWCLRDRNNEMELVYLTHFPSKVGAGTFNESVEFIPSEAGFISLRLKRFLWGFSIPKNISAVTLEGCSALLMTFYFLSTTFAADYRQIFRNVTPSGRSLSSSVHSRTGMDRVFVQQRE